MAYNEEFIMPFFLHHYSYLNGIHLIVDSDTTDRTREIARRWSNVTIEEFRFPDGMDDVIKRDKLNAAARSISDADWIYVLDADEFIFPPKLEDPRAFLARQSGNVVRAKMWNVFRHSSDTDLDPECLYGPAVLQRRHGNPDRHHPWDKPIVVKMPFSFTMDLGNHFINGLNGPGFVEMSNESYDGAHWAHADPCFCVERSFKHRRQRQSRNNLKLGLTTHHHHVTEDGIRALCKANENLPLLF